MMNDEVKAMKGEMKGAVFPILQSAFFIHA
jgi:hypothetical protein